MSMTFPSSLWLLFFLRAAVTFCLTYSCPLEPACALVCVMQEKLNVIIYTEGLQIHMIQCGDTPEAVRMLIYLCVVNPGTGVLGTLLLA